jgi:hypothetical protein
MRGRETWRCRMRCGANEPARLLLCRTHIVCMWGAGAAAISLAGGAAGRTRTPPVVAFSEAHTERGVCLPSFYICAICVCCM